MIAPPVFVRCRAMGAHGSSDRVTCANDNYRNEVMKARVIYVSRLLGRFSINRVVDATLVDLDRNLITRLSSVPLFVRLLRYDIGTSRRACLE